MGEQMRGRVRERWAHLRFSIGQLRARCRHCGVGAERAWRHRTTGEFTRFGFSIIERWYYRALTINWQWPHQASLQESAR
jgi:hypothetical protein